MQRSTIYSFVFVPMLAIAVAWVKFSNPMQATQITQSTPAGRADEVTSEHRPGIITGDTGTRTGFTDLDAPGSARVSGGVATSTSFNPKFVLKAMHHGPNHPPVVNSPLNDRSRVVLFPRGPGATLEFEGEPATDHEEDNLTYRFGIAIPGKLGIQSPEEALLTVTREDNRFLIRPYGIITPAEFASVYGNVATVPVLPAAIYASDGNSESEPMFFDLSLVYDGAARFSVPAEYMGEQRRETPEPIARFEGTSDRGDEAFRSWKAVTAESRVWRFDPSARFLKTIRTIQTTG